MPKPVRTTRAMSEAQLQQGIVAHARIMGWKVHFVPDSLYKKNFASKARRAQGDYTYALDMGDPGFPDLVLVRGDAVWYRELKVGYNDLTENQEEWRDRLIAAGQDWELWRDKEYDDVIKLLNDAAVGS